MTTDQAAVLWWRQLLAELGTAANRRSPGAAGAAALARVKSVRELLYKLLRRAEIDLLLEIGAHAAESSKRFVRMKPAARAVAYEASPDVYQRTVAAGLEGITLINKAIGSRIGPATLHVPVNEKLHHWSSLKPRLLRPVPTREVEVEMTTLEAAARAVSDGEGRNAALWVDVEGAGFEVLASGIEFLKERTALVYIEMSDIETYEGANTSLGVLRLLLECGFIPVARDNQYRDAYNLLAVHSSLYLRFQDVFARWHYSQLAHDGTDPEQPAPESGLPAQN